MENNGKGLYAQIKEANSTITDYKLSVEDLKEWLKVMADRASTQPIQQIAYKQVFEQLDDDLFISCIEDENTKWICGEETYTYIQNRYNKIKGNGE